MSAARFATGARVRILDLPTPGHVRTPRYLRGAQGIVERHCGAHRNPEALAYGRDGLPRIDLYRVRVSLAELWAGAAAGDVIEVEIYDHWLAPC